MSCFCKRPKAQQLVLNLFPKLPTGDLVRHEVGPMLSFLRADPTAARAMLSYLRQLLGGFVKSKRTHMAKIAYRVAQIMLEEGPAIHTLVGLEIEMFIAVAIEHENDSLRLHALLTLNAYLGRLNEESDVAFVVSIVPRILSGCSAVLPAGEAEPSGKHSVRVTSLLCVQQLLRRKQRAVVRKWDEIVPALLANIERELDNAESQVRVLAVHCLERVAETTDESSVKHLLRPLNRFLNAEHRWQKSEAFSRFCLELLARVAAPRVVWHLAIGFVRKMRARDEGDRIAVLNAVTHLFSLLPFEAISTEEWIVRDLLRDVLLSCTADGAPSAAPATSGPPSELQSAALRCIAEFTSQEGEVLRIASQLVLLAVDFAADGDARYLLARVALAAASHVITGGKRFSAEHLTAAVLRGIASSFTHLPVELRAAAIGVLDDILLRADVHDSVELSLSEHASTVASALYAMLRTFEFTPPMLVAAQGLMEHLAQALPRVIQQLVPVLLTLQWRARRRASMLAPLVVVHMQAFVLATLARIGASLRAEGLETAARAALDALMKRPMTGSAAWHVSCRPDGSMRLVSADDDVVVDRDVQIEPADVALALRNSTDLSDLSDGSDAEPLAEHVDTREAAGSSTSVGGASASPAPAERRTSGRSARDSGVLPEACVLSKSVVVDRLLEAEALASYVADEVDAWRAALLKQYSGTKALLRQFATGIPAPPLFMSPSIPMSAPVALSGLPQSELPKLQHTTLESSIGDLLMSPSVRGDAASSGGPASVGGVGAGDVALASPPRLSSSVRARSLSGGALGAAVGSGGGAAGTGSGASAADVSANAVGALLALLRVESVPSAGLVLDLLEKRASAGGVPADMAPYATLAKLFTTHVAAL